MSTSIDFEEFFIRFSEREPNPTTELFYTNNYTLLVAVVLSAQSTDVGVNKATKTLFKIADDPIKIIELGHEALLHHIKTIGLCNGKAKNIIALSKILRDRFSCKVPADFNSLISLPGVGSKTAHVVMNCAFGANNIGVDTHVFRVSNRIGMVSEKNIQKAESILNDIIPEKWARKAHHWLVLHGRYICKARTPNCQECFVSDLCNYFQNTQQK